ncbi:hypothetical protein U062_00589 [Gammaproteobacteria bacterium MOLA455]|nr:hypothetical protein U062_00589 [Gammaproteobacteria bacterium MOLA455]
MLVNFTPSIEVLSMDKLKALLVTALAVAFSVSANAAIDATAVVAEIASNSVPILAVGGALLTLAGIAIGIKWIKGTIFG